MTETLRDRAQGRWPGLLAAMGVDARYLTGKHGPCPVCQQGRDRFRFDDREGRGTWICSVCGAGDGFTLLMKIKGWDFKELAREVEAHVGTAPRKIETRQERSEKSLRDAMNQLWRAGVAVQNGDPVGRYLKRRGVSIDPWPPSLRYVERCRYQGEAPSFHPAMIAKVTGADGKPVSIHRTYLTADGAKAAVEQPRRLMPGKIGKGCAIRLAPAGAMLGIAEGIETALSAAILFAVPCWAAVSAAMLMAWEPPTDVQEVIVFGDSDKGFAGQSAAFALAHRLSARGVQARVELPPEMGTDWNDVLAADAQQKESA